MSRTPRDGIGSPATPSTRFAPLLFPALGWPCGRICPLTSLPFSMPCLARASSRVSGQDKDGQVHNAVADEGEFPELLARISGADAAALLPMYVDERVPLLSTVMPDSDGVVRARWQVERSLGDSPQRP